jgi:pyrroloquinoline quinone biosynthesis protein B
MWVRVLGAAAGGGFPQWNCHCSNCRRLRQGTLRGNARSQAQAAVSSDGHCWHLLNASPDLRGQIESAAFLWPAEGVRHSPIRSVTLCSAEIDAVMGLLSLREFQPFTVYSTRAVQDILLCQNNLFHALQRLPNQVKWSVFSSGGVFQPDTGLPVQAIPLRSDYPTFVTTTHEPEEAGVGLAVGNGGCQLLFLPAVAEITEDLLGWMEQCDLLLFDGTFWSDDELIRVQQGARTARQMNHVPISGPGGSLEVLSRLKRPRKVYMHINNTNPVLDEDSPEHRAVVDAGWELAFDGMEFEL